MLPCISYKERHYPRLITFSKGLLSSGRGKLLLKLLKQFQLIKLIDGSKKNDIKRRNDERETHKQPTILVHEISYNPSFHQPSGTPIHPANGYGTGSLSYMHISTMKDQYQKTISPTQPSHLIGELVISSASLVVQGR